MLDSTGLPALDVAIGLSFVFLLLSLVASAMQEFVANLLSLRSKVLERGLRNMLADGTPGTTSGTPRDLLFRIYAHPLIRSLYRESWFAPGRKTLKPAAGTEQPADPTPDTSAIGPAPEAIAKVRLPSYIAPRSFALALLDTIAPKVLLTDEAGRAHPPHDVIKDTRAAIEGLNIPGGVKRRLLALLDDARGDIDAFRTNIEAWFDDTMARVSGWYKRRTQIIIVVLAVLITAALNANALTIGERLWRDPTVRATLVQQAGAATKSTPGDGSEKLNNAVNNVDAVAKIGVPLGWAQSKNQTTDPRHISLDTVGSSAHLVGGWLLTILAVSLGAPFWFDALSRMSRLRGTGKPEAPLPASGRGLPGERVVTGTAPVHVNVYQTPAPPA
jgi:hypothetical protein